jgi:sugar phosphate isomerase/epimerase
MCYNPADKRRHTLIALSTGSLHTYGLSRVFQLAAEVGFDGIEVMIDAPNDNRNAAYLEQLSNQHDLPIVALHSPFVYRIPDWPADQLGRLERTVALAQELGVTVVVTHLPYRVYGIVCQWHGAKPRWVLLPVFLPRRGPYYHLLRHEERLAQMEADSGVKIAVENMPARRLLGIPLSLYWFNRVSELSRFPHLTLDTTHIGTWGADPLKVYSTLAHRVAHVHLSNYDGREHRPPPDGQLALDALLHRLAADGFQGAVSIECGPKAFEAEDPQACRAALERTLAFCRQHYSD